MTNFKASVLLYALLCAQVADWGMTVWALSLGAVEANPIMAPLFAMSPFVALLPKLGIVGLATLVYLGTRRLGRLSLGLIALSLVVSLPPVAWNLIQLWNAGLL